MLRVAGRDALGQRLRRVVGDVEHRLDQLLAVAAELGDRDVVVALDRRGRAGTRPAISERTRSQTSWMLTSPTTCGLAVRREQAVDQRLQAVGLVDDDLGVLGQRARLDLHLQQLRRAADAAERVLDLVREVADQLLVGLGLVERALLAVLPRLLLDLDHLDQHDVRASRRSG